MSQITFFGGTCLLLVWFSVALDLKTLELNWIELANVANYVLWGYLSIGLVFCCYGFGTLELNMKFGIFLFHKLLKPLPPHQVVNGKWIIHSAKITKKGKWKVKRESGVQLPTFKPAETKMTLKIILDPQDFALLFSSTAPNSLHTEAKRPPQ